MFKRNGRYLTGYIFEMECNSGPELNDGDVYVGSIKKLAKITESGLISIYDFGCQPAFNFLLGGLWVYVKGNKANAGVQRFIDLFNSGVEYKNVEIRFGSKALEVSQGEIVGFNFESDPPYFFIYNANNESISKLICEYSDFSFDGSHIYAKDCLVNIVCCLDLELNEVWRSTLQGVNYGDWTKIPQLFEDLVLVNHAFNIIALCKKDGQEVWRYKFDSSCGPTCCNLIGDKLYAECFGTGYVINPRNGKVIHEVPLGFPSGEQKQCVSTYFYPFQDKLVALSGHDGSVRVFSGDGAMLLQELHCPKEYKISSNIPPVITDDAIYQSVHSQMAFAGGVLVLSISDNELDSVIEIQERPEIHIIKQAEQDGKHAYNLYVDATDADTINRFGQISIKEIHLETGSEVYSDDLEYDGRDKQHNGQINFFVDPTVLSGFEKERIKSDLRELEAYFKELDCTAGDGTSAIKIKVLFKPKSEWDLSGYTVDLKQLRETRWENEPDEMGYS